MNQPTLHGPRQQASAIALALTFTLGTLMGLNMLAKPADTTISMAAGAASAAKVVSQGVRTPRG